MRTQNLRSCRGLETSGTRRAEVRRVARPGTPPPSAQGGPESPGKDAACPRCGDRARDTALIPCGHVLCSVCVESYGEYTCPVCGQGVAQTMRVHL